MIEIVYKLNGNAYTEASPSYAAARKWANQQFKAFPAVPHDDPNRFELVEIRDLKTRAILMDTAQFMTSQVIKFFARKLVSIYYVVEDYVENDDGTDLVKKLGVRWYIASGFILVVSGRWYYLTAGHVLHHLDLAVKYGALAVCRLVDGMGSDAEFPETLPLGYSPEIGQHFDYDNDSGEDYGLIRLSDLVVEGLKRNKIEPVDEKHWANEPSEFDAFGLFGTPAYAIQTAIPPWDKYPHLRSISATLMPVEPNDTPPDVLKKPFGRFYGRVLGDADIGGMSGGPLLGFKSTIDGTTLNFVYWFVGVQSGWEKSSRTVAACPFRAFAMAVDESLRKSIEAETPHHS